MSALINSRSNTSGQYEPKGRMQMNKMIAASCLLLLTAFTGCNNLSPRDNLSPRLEQQLENIEGNQNTLENNQNAIKLEIGRLQQSLAIDGNQNEIQQGWLNVQADGIIIGVFSILIVGLMLWFMRSSMHNKQATAIMGEQIKEADNEDVKESLMAAAWHTNVEKTIFNLIE